jgi:hypothetical protein
MTVWKRRGETQPSWCITVVTPRNSPAVMHAKPSNRHAREGGHPGLYRDMALKSLDPRVRGDDGLEEARRNPTVVVQHRRDAGQLTCRDARETHLSPCPRNPPTVMPAKAGIQGFIATWL